MYAHMYADVCKHGVRAGGKLETHLLSVEVYIRKGKYLKVLQVGICALCVHRPLNICVHRPLNMCAQATKHLSSLLNIVRMHMIE
jgi:hypothetical protein